VGKNSNNWVEKKKKNKLGAEKQKRLGNQLDQKSPSKKGPVWGDLERGKEPSRQIIWIVKQGGRGAASRPKHEQCAGTRPVKLKG